MMRYRLTLKGNSPLVIRMQRQQSEYMPCMEFIPANSLRGAFANYYLSKSGNSAKDDHFQRLFIHPGIRFSDFLPVGYHYPTRSYVTCSVRPGSPPFGHYQADLIPYLVAKALGRDAELPEPVCPVCGATVAQSDRLISEDLSKRWIPDKRLLKRIRKIFYNPVRPQHCSFYEALPAGIDYTGFVQAPEELVDIWNTFAQKGNQMQIGAERSQGMGALTLEKIDEDNQVVDSAGKYASFQSALEAHIGALPNGCVVFSVALLSDVLLLDHLMRYRFELTMSDLHVAQPEWIKSFRLIKSISAATLLRSYNSHPDVQLPRAPERLLARGSLFIFANIAEDGSIIHLGNSWNETGFTAFLAEIEANGVGEMRDLGLGQVSICSPIISNKPHLTDVVESDSLLETSWEVL